MNIGIDIRKIRDYGIGTHIRNVILYAAGRDPANRYFLFCHPSDFQQPGNNFVWISDNSPKYSLAEHFSLAKKAAEQKLDLFHSPHFTLPFRLKQKAIVTIHDLIHLKFSQFFPHWKVRAAEFVIQKAIRKAEVIIAVSQTTKEDILNFFPRAQGKVEVLYNRLSDDWIASGDGYDTASLGLNKDYLLYVGNFKKHKGIETLIQAYQQLKDPPPLVLVGKSAGMDQDLSDAIFSDPRIRVFGFADTKLLRTRKKNDLEFEVNHQDTSTWYASRRISEKHSAHKVLIEKPSGRILGAHLLGAHSEELINLFGLAISFGLRSPELKDLLFAYPTNFSNIPYMV